MKLEASPGREGLERQEGWEGRRDGRDRRKRGLEGLNRRTTDASPNVTANHDAESQTKHED
jgi:hypothetical protein